MHWKRFIITTVFVYTLISIPGILSVGYVIDWVPEATVFQKVKGYAVEGLTANFLLKLPIAAIIGFFASVFNTRKDRSKA
ncbi:hypothetical protein AB685_17695 [Bacillus sp. LL01]|uniref:hypothetical protein n=1 Tax=Bacillus sp. LL01 TaxID=1665556 RepID=UPI00064D051F|nr:hypothetical protein [Bacillus sp. LL01]KMJ57235.1 hypothetical protein AB685_17695 [Bacillus sp. LL01]